MHADLLSRVAQLRQQASELRSMSSFLPPPDESEEYGEGGGQRASARDVAERKQQLMLQSTAARLESAESERKALLDFLQSDMGNTAVLARRLELLEDDLQASKDSEAAALQRLADAESACKRERATAASLDQQISAYQRALDEATVDNELLRKAQGSTEHQLPALREEAALLRSQLRAANEQLGVAQPRLQQVEPEMQRLRKEKNDWALERSHLLEELSRLSPLAQLLGDVETEFISKSFTSVDHLPAVSAWSVGPELRRLCPRLYDYLRLLSQAIYRKEAECTEALDARARAEQALSTYAAEAEHRESAQRAAVDKHAHALERSLHQIAVYEAELPVLQGAQQAVAQIRATLATFPGGLKGLFQAISFDAEAAASAASRAGSLVVDERNYGYGNEFSARQKKTPSSSSSFSSYSSSSSSKPDGGLASQSSLKSKSAGTKFKLSPDLVTDDQLAAVVGKALAHNFNAVASLKEATLLLQQREAAYETLRAEHARLSRRFDARKDTIDELKGSISRMSDSQRGQEDKLKHNLETAAELVENQNMFALMLEAKLEESKRSLSSMQRQLDGAAREEASLRSRLWRVLKEAGHSPPSLESSSVGELLDMVSAALLSQLQSSQRAVTNDDFRPKTVTFSERKRTSPQAPSTPTELYADISNFMLSPTKLYTQPRDEAFDASLLSSPDPSAEFKWRLQKASQTLNSLRE